MVELFNITKSYGSHIVLNDVSIALNDIGVVGLLGQNGAGKSTLMNIISGCLSPSKGNVLINGVDMFISPKKAKSNLGYLPEKPPLYPELSVLQFLNYIYEIKNCSFDKNAHINEICKVSGISEVKNRIIRNLSKGYQQRVGFAQSLIGNPQIIILDEPTIGLDPTQIIDFRNTIIELGKSRLVIISSHMLSEIQAISSRVLILNNGKLTYAFENSNSKNKSEFENISLLISGETEIADKFIETLKNIAIIEKIIRTSNSEVRLLIKNNSEYDIRPIIAKNIVSLNLNLLELNTQVFSLEEIYLQMMEGGQNN